MREQIMQILDIAEKTYYNWKNQERPIIVFLEKYLSSDEIEEFLKTGEIQKLEVCKNINIEDMKYPKDSETLRLLEDFAKYGLFEKVDELFKIFGIPNFAMFLPKKLFIKILSDINKEESLTHENGKAFLLQRLKGYETSITKLEHKNHPKILYDFVSNKLSKIEVYLLIKNVEEYLNWYLSSYSIYKNHRN